MERFTLLKHSQKETPKIINILELSKTTFTFTQLEETLIRSDFRCIHGLYFNSIKTLKSCVTRKEISENFFIHYHSKVWTHTLIPHRFLHVKIIVKWCKLWSSTNMIKTELKLSCSPLWAPTLWGDFKQLKEEDEHFMILLL